MNIEIANRLIELRKQKGFSQEELANKLGVSRQAVSKWECGEASPDTDNLIALSKLYEISLDEIVGNNVKSIKKDKIEIDAKSVTIHDDEGQSLEIKNYSDHDEDDDDKYTRNQHLSIDLTEAICFVGVLATYITLGLTQHLWHPWWFLFFLPDVVTSVLRAIFSKKATKFNAIFLTLFVYFLLSLVIIKSFSLTWIVFFIIPIYYTFANIIKKYKK